MENSRLEVDVKTDRLWYKTSREQNGRERERERDASEMR
jgi:hypothetical protein